MTLATGEFIRRFLMHVLPKGFHRIRHYGLLAHGCRAANIARVRALLKVTATAPVPTDAKPSDDIAAEPASLQSPCPCCGGRMLIIEIFARGSVPRYGPTPAVVAPGRIDTS